MTHRWRSTVRVRLTLLYAGAFFLAGLVLVALTYVYFRQSLTEHVSRRADVTGQLAAGYVNSGDTDALQRLHQALGEQFRQDRDDTLQSLLGWSLASLVVVGLGAAGFGWLMAGRALRPLRQITATARRVADRSLHERIALTGPRDEVKDLADTFDAMLERLDRSFDSQRRFVANASHELRTPLTINRTLIQVALDEPDTPPAIRQLGATLLEVNRRHERLIDGLLVLATSDQPLTEREPVDLVDIVRHATAVGAGAARAAGLAVHTSAAAAPVTGDPVLLERLVQNLLDNAVRYNVDRDGWARLSTGTADGHAFLTVENTGPVVPADDVAGLFEPFRRLAVADRHADTDPASRDRGAGLGLSIVRAVAHAHHGTVYARPRPGGGLTVRVRLPIA